MKRYISIDDATASATFDVPKSAKRAYVELTFLGDCAPCLRHDPTSLDNGTMIVHWDSNARSMKAGWYHLDVFVDGCKCNRFLGRVVNDCFAHLVSQDEYNECYECDGLPKGKPSKCCSTVLKRERCDVQICPPDKSRRPQHYTPDYDEV